jgi:hypothetical protein
MAYVCRAERAKRATYDEVTLEGIAGTREVLFEDTPCRIWEIQGAMSIQMGETDIMSQNLQLSLPWDSPILKKHDEIVITTAPDSDTSMQGKRFEILSSARAGELRATRRYQVTAVERR